MTTAGVAAADCISDCEANCLFGDPGQIGLCISSCPAQCAVPLEPPCITTGGVNACSTTAVRLTPSNTGVNGKWTLSNDGAAAGSKKAFMTLSCSQVAVVKTVFKGSKTVNVGTTQQHSCGLSGFTFSSTCGRALTCSGGVP